MFDAAALGVAIDAEHVWNGEFQPAALRSEVLGRLTGAYRLAESLVQRPRYNDAHCWVFTPRSFLGLAEEFAILGFFPFAIETFHPTQAHGIEFQVRLTALGPDRLDEALASIQAARTTLADAAAPDVPEPAEAAASDQLLRDLIMERDRQRQMLEAMRASTSWKATAPLRAIGRMLKKRT